MPKKRQPKKSNKEAARKAALNELQSALDAPRVFSVPDLAQYQEDKYKFIREQVDLAKTKRQLNGRNHDPVLGEFYRVFDGEREPWMEKFSHRIWAISPDRTICRADNNVEPPYQLIRDLVGGYIELLQLSDSLYMYIDEEGKLKDDPQINIMATVIVREIRPDINIGSGNYGNAILIGYRDGYNDEIAEAAEAKAQESYDSWINAFGSSEGLAKFGIGKK